jgi:alkyl sulfatase BDS1-like metallo-beta-lactamase superfamily hydrolase
MAQNVWETMGALFDVWTEPAGQTIEVAPRAWSVCPRSVNVGVIETDEGVVLVDAGMPSDGLRVRELVRSVTPARLHTVIFTHGHIDHAFGLGPLLEEMEGGRPRIVAHRNTLARFRRYARTSKMNANINARQAGRPRNEMWWPQQEGDFFWPDTVYNDRLLLRVGGEELHLHHAKGETDDVTWIWMPSRKLVCVGDLWLGVCPNAGNPQKVQRYAEEWADAAEQIAALGAEAMIPGHAMPVNGASEIRQRWLDLAALLHYIVDYTIDGLNNDLTHEDIVLGLKLPPALADKPYLRPLHDRPEFIVRNLIRRYGGWWDGRPANVVPAPVAAQARELVGLAGGADRVVARAWEVATDDLPLACHLAEWAVLAAPTSRAAQACAAELFERRFAAETSFQARGIYRAAVNQANAALARLDDP